MPSAWPYSAHQSGSTSCFFIIPPVAVGTTHFTHSDYVYNIKVSC